MDRIYKGVWDKVNGGGKFGQALFSFAYEYKWKQLENGYDTPLLNKLVTICCLSFQLKLIVISCCIM